MAITLTPATVIPEPPEEQIMSDTTTTTTTDGDHGGHHYSHGSHGNDFGRAADHLAYESMTTPKDTIASVERHGNRLSDGQNAIQRDIAAAQSHLNETVTDAKAVVGGLITDSSFRALEQFGINGVAAAKYAAATDVLIQKTTGELITQVTLTAKDGVIDAAKNAAATTLQAEKLASASYLQAEKIASATAAAIAECCCEQKMLALANKCELADLIRDQSDATRALINSIEKDRQAVALVDCKIENSNLRQDERFRAILSNLSVGTGK